MKFQHAPVCVPARRGEGGSCWRGKLCGESGGEGLADGGLQCVDGQPHWEAGTRELRSRIHPLLRNKQ